MRLRVSLAIGSLLITHASAAFAIDPSSIIETRDRIDGLSVEQRREQRPQQRLLQHAKTPEIETRRKQQKPTVHQSKQSQRIRRALQMDRERIRQLRLQRREVRSEQLTVPGEPSRDDVRMQILLAVNRERATLGIGPVQWNAILGRSSQEYAADLLARGYFSHESPEGENPQHRIQRAGYGNLTIDNCNCRSFKAYFGENLAKGQKTVENVMEDWMNSPDHRANILSEKFNELGVGIAGNVWVQHFGSQTIELK